MQSFYIINKHVSLVSCQLGLVFFLLLSTFISLQAQSATETAGTVASNGSGNPWSPLTASNLSSSDGNRISAIAPTSMTPPGDPTQFLDLTGFNFNLPAGATINGIVVEIERQKTANNRDIRDNTIQLLKAGNPVGQNKASTTGWINSDVTASYGGSTDLWMTTWTEAEIEASGFGLRIAIEDFGGTGGAQQGQINQVQITVHYSVGGVSFSCISVDATSTTTASGAVSSITLNHTTGTGNNRLMLVGISIEQDDGGTANITGVTYGTPAQTLTLVNPAGTTSGEAQAQIWQLVNPASGTGTVTINVSGADAEDAFVVGVTTLEGVNQSTPLVTPATANTDGTSPSEITVNSVPSDDVVFGVIAHDDARPITSFTTGSQTELWDEFEGTFEDDGITGGGVIKPGTGGNVTLSWNLDDENDGSSLVAVRVQCAGFDLALSKTLLEQTPAEDFNADGLTTYSPGETVTFEIQINNVGVIDATNIALIDYFNDSELTLASGNWTQVATGAASTATLNTPIASIMAGNSETVLISFLINADYTGTLIENRAEITAATGGTDSDSTPDSTNGENCSGAGDEDDHDCVDVPVTQTFDLALRKEFVGFTDNDLDGLRTDGDVVQFVITIFNQGTVDATSITVIDYIPTQLDQTTAALTSGSYTSLLGNTINITDNLSSTGEFILTNGLPAGDEVAILMNIEIDNSGAQASVTNAAEISTAANASGTITMDVDSDFDTTNGNTAGENTDLVDDEIDGNGKSTTPPNASEDEDDHDIALITINPLFDLALTNEVQNFSDAGTIGSIDNGDQITLRMTIYNQGTEDATNIQVVHYFDNTVLSLNDVNWGALAAGQVTLNPLIPSLTAGSNTTIDVTFNVVSSAASILTFAEIFSFNNIGGGNNDVDSQVATLDSGGADETNDAGGLAGSANDNFIGGDGTGTAGDGVAATDEDDHDPALYAFACDLNIDDITVNRTFDANTGETSFDVIVNFSWDNSGTDVITVEVGSMSTTFNTTTLAGSGNATVGSFATPAFDVPVRIAFQSNPVCASAREIHLIADTDACSSGLGGVVFQDFDLDGVRDTPNEAGLPNIRVYVYDDNDAEVYSTYTNTLGQWSTSGLGAGPYRIEFDPSLNDRYASAFATSGTTVQFWSSGDCNIDAGFLAPDDYCDMSADRTMITPCYVSGDPLVGDVANENWVVQFPYPPSNTQGDNVYLAQGNPTGTTWGTAVRNVDPTFTLYLSAFMRRHSGFGLGGPGAIYALDLTDLSNPPSTVTTTTFVDLDDPTFNFDFGTDPRGTDLNNPALPGNPTDPSYDPLAFDLVGKMAMGDLDFDEEQNVLWTVNLHTREVYEIQLGPNGAAPTMASDITVHSLPDPGCSNGVFRAWAVEFFDGKLYIGGVCTAELAGGTRDDLVAYIYSHDPNGAVGNWSEVFSFPLDYDRGYLSKQGSRIFEGEWNPWLSDWNDIGAANTPYAHLPTPDNGPYGQTAAPQPVFSDIEFDADGSIVVGIADRFGWQIGNNNYSTNFATNDTDVYEGVAGGDILRISRINGVLTLENNANANTVDGNQTTSGQNSNPAQGPGGGEFYWQDMYRLSGNKNSGTHQEITGGSLMLVPCEAEIATVVFDPASEYRAGGAIGLSNIDGSRTWSYQIFGRDAGGRGATFGKAISFGDIQLFYDASPPLQIGNRVFVDTDKDGVQDPSEGGVANVQVALFDDSGTLLATTTTDANGNYTFTGDGTTGETWENTGDAIMANTQYYVVFGTDGDTGGGAADQFDTGTSFLSANGVDYQLTTANSGNGAIPENNDSDAEFENNNAFSWLGYPAISVNTGATGFSNHTFDMGLQQSYDLALVKMPASSTPNILAPGDNVVFTITVYNQGTIPAAGIQITDYIPAGDATYSGTNSTPNNANLTSTLGNTVMLTNNGDGTFALDALAPGDDVSFDIELTIDGGFSGPILTNTAEISVDDGDDEDSTPSATNGDQPGETDPLLIDDEFNQDGAVGDEDDHDVAFVVVCPLQTPSLVCAHGSGSVTLEADPGLTNIRWFATNGTDDTADDTEILAFAGMQSVNIDANTEGMADGSDAYYYTAEDASGCDVSLCCPVPVQTELCYDWGDLPDAGSVNPGPYPTDMTDDGGEGVGPSHGIINGLLIGATVDDEDDGNPSANANGDDNTDLPDDEDGIATFPTFEAGQTVIVNVTATNSGTVSMDDATLYAFFDWNGDGDFDDPDEIVTAPVPNNSVNANIPLMVMVPIGATTGQDLGVRLRLTTDDLNDAGRLMTYEPWQGPAADGEVEDYLIQVEAPSTVALGNLVFLDANNNGLFDTGVDSGIDGVEVQLLDDNNMPVDNPNIIGMQDYIVTTSGGGFYEFDNLPPGNYKVLITANNFTSGQPLEGLTGSSPEGTDNDQDDNADENGQNTLFSGGVISTVIELTVGGEPENEAGQGAYSGILDDNSANMTVDFGFVGPVSVGDFVWIDLDNDGLQDVGEPGLDDVDVTIYDAATNMPVTQDLQGNAYTATQTTAGGGMYQFDDLPPGSYYVIFDLTDIPDIYAVTTQDVDGNVSNDADSDASTTSGQTVATPALTSGQADLSLDMGVFCILDAEAGTPATVCGTGELLLSSISPSVTPASQEATAVWNTSGDGTFFSAAAADLGNMDVPFNNAFSYQPGTQDALNGSVTLTLTVGPAGECDEVSDQVTITVLKVDCGNFPWDGN